MIGLFKERTAMLRDFNTDRISLIKYSGAVAQENVPALVTGSIIFVADENFPVEVSDHILRTLPSGLVEDYVVVDPVFYSKALTGADSHFQIKVRKHGSPASKQSIVQGITNNFHGPNSRVNINSTDKSINVAASISAEQIASFIAQVRPVIEHLPEHAQAEIQKQIQVLEEEEKTDSPSQLRVRGALQSIRTVAEGAGGNLVATGIQGLISSLFG